MGKTLAVVRTPVFMHQIFEYPARICGVRAGHVNAGIREKPLPCLCHGRRLPLLLPPRLNRVAPESLQDLPLPPGQRKFERARRRHKLMSPVTTGELSE